MYPPFAVILLRAQDIRFLFFLPKTNTVTASKKVIKINPKHCIYIGRDAIDITNDKRLADIAQTAKLFSVSK